MTDHVMSKYKIKRLKKLEKSQPLLFARVAATEMDLGRFRQARKRLENGLERYPDYTTARILLAECYSILNENEKALEQWKTARKQDPYNRKILTGLISELAINSESEALNEAMFALYNVDPFDEKNTRRLKENLLERVKKTHPEITSWPMDWHPADFTPGGAFAKRIAGQLGLMEPREELPEDVRPEIDLAAVEEIVSRMVAEPATEDSEEPALEEQQTETLVDEPDIVAEVRESTAAEPEIVPGIDMGIEDEKAAEGGPDEDIFEISLPVEETPGDSEALPEAVSQDEENAPDALDSDTGMIASDVEEGTSDAVMDDGEKIEETREETETITEESSGEDDDFDQMLELTDKHLAEKPVFVSADEMLERLLKDEEETKESEVAAKNVASSEDDSGLEEKEETVPDFHEAFELAGIEPEETVDIAALMNRISGGPPPLVDPPDIQTPEQRQSETETDSAEPPPDTDDAVVAQREVVSKDIIIGNLPDEVVIERLAGAEDVEVVPVESATPDAVVRLEPSINREDLEKEEIRKLIRLLDKREQPAETKEEPETEVPASSNTEDTGADFIEETEIAAVPGETTDQAPGTDTVPEAGQDEPEAPSEEKPPGSGLGLKNNEMNRLEEELESLGGSSAQEFAEIGAKFAENVIIPENEESREAADSEPSGESDTEFSAGEAPPADSETAPPETKQETKQGNGQPVGIRGPVTKTFAQVLLNQEQFQLALETCEKLLENNPNDQDVKRMIIQAKTGLEQHGD